MTFSQVALFIQKNDNEAKRKEEKSKEKQRKKAEKAFLAAKNKKLKRLRTDIKKSCSKVFKRKWRKKSEFECEFDKDIADLETYITKAKVMTLYQKNTFDVILMLQRCINYG